MTIEEAGIYHRKEKKEREKDSITAFMEIDGQNINEYDSQQIFNTCLTTRHPCQLLDLNSCSKKEFQNQ